MTGRVIEIEYSKGWGRVLLDDGRVMPFDTAACHEGIPQADARVAVELVPGRMGGEKIRRLIVETSWHAGATVPYVALHDYILVLRDGVVEQAPTSPECAAGQTGYAVIEVRRGVVGHSTAWRGSLDGGSLEDERVGALRPAPLTESERALFAAALRELADELVELAHDAEGEGDRAAVQETLDELAALTAIGTRLARQAASRDN